MASLSPAQVSALLDNLCIKLGFCLPLAEQRKLQANPPESVIEFTDAVFVAEGLNPEHADRRTYRAVRDHITAAFIRAEARR